MVEECDKASLSGRFPASNRLVGDLRCVMHVGLFGLWDSRSPQAIPTYRYILSVQRKYTDSNSHRGFHMTICLASMVPQYSGYILEGYHSSLKRSSNYATSDPVGHSAGSDDPDVQGVPRCNWDRWDLQYATRPDH